MTAGAVDYRASQLTPEQLEQRKTTIGASDVPIILGLKRYPDRNAFTVWQEKTARKSGTFTGNDATEWGNRMEPLIRDKVRELWGVGGGVVADSPGTLVRDGWKSATPDGLMCSREGEVGSLEIKNRYHGEGWGPDGSSSIPADVEAQIRWQMHVGDFAYGVAAVLISGMDFRMYFLPRDLTQEAELVEKVTTWREAHIVKDEAPGGWTQKVHTMEPPVSSEGTAAAVAELARAYKALKLRGEKIADQASAIRESIEALHAGVKTIKFEGGRSTLAQVKGRGGVKWQAVVDALRPVDPIKVANLVAEHTIQGEGYSSLTVTIN